MRSLFDTRRLTGRLFYLLVAFLTAYGTSRALPPPTTTTISDVVYRADGSPASGTLLITWSQFTTSDQKAVAAGTMNVPIGAGGAVNVALAPNAGATPAGTFYKVTYKLDDGTSSTEYWTVPATSPTTISAIRSTLVPATAAVQMVSRNYVDGALATKAVDTAVVHKAGDSMAGPLILSGDPTAANQAATKNYVDANGGAQIAQKLNRTGDTPTDLAGARYATQFANIQAAITAAGTSGSVVIPSNYAATDSYTNPNHVPVIDLRNGSFQVNNLGGSVRIANTFSGADVGAKANAADADLGASAGEIWLFGGGNFATQAIVSSNHTLRLFEGTYTNAFGEYIPPILLKDNSALVCDSWQTILQNSSNPADHENVVVAAYNATINSGGPGIPNNSHATATGLSVKGCHFKDSGLGTNTSLTATVAFVNCKNCKVLNNWFDGIASSHVTLVGSSAAPENNFGDTDEIAGNHHSGATDAAVSVINNRNVDIHDEFFHGHGNGAAAFIDLEGNISTDHMEEIDIHDNVMDATDALNSVYGVTCNSAGANQHNIKIHDNLIYGLPNSASNKLIQGVACGSSANSYSDVEIYNNEIYNTVQTALSVGGMPRAFVHDNRIHCSGGFGITIQSNVFDSVIQNNVLSAPLSGCNGATSNWRVMQFNSIVESAGADRNNYINNVASRVLLSGANSKVLSNSTIEGTGKTERTPFGVSSFAGGLQLTQLSAPTLSVTTGAAGSCVLGSGNYFWKVTSVDANGGESTGSNEVNQNAGGGFGCAELSWTFVPGAVSYNVYRSTTTNTEQLIANVAGFDLAYADLGGQTPTSSVPGSNTTSSIIDAEGGVPPGASGKDLLWADSAGHCWKFNANNAGNSGCIPGTGIAQTWSGTQTFSSVASVTSSTANPASAGQIRLAQTDVVKFRNQANSGDLSALSESADVLQVGDTGGINVPGPIVGTAVTGSGAVTGASISVGGESFTGTPRIAWGSFLPGALSSTWTAAQFTPKKAINVVQIDLRAKAGPAGCTTFPVVQLTDGTTPINVTLNSAGVSQTVAGGQNYAANSTLLVKVSTAGAGCTTNASDVNVTVQYKMQ